MPWFVEVCKSIFPAESIGSTVFYDLWGRLTSSKYTIFSSAVAQLCCMYIFPEDLLVPLLASSSSRNSICFPKVKRPYGTGHPGVTPFKDRLSAK